MDNKMSAERGFTLIEMMVVVAIIAVLVAILVPNFIRARSQAQTAACQSNLKEIATAAELYYTDNSTYPGDGSGSIAVTASSTQFSTYLKQTPVDPSVGPGSDAAHQYAFTSTRDSSGVWSYTISCPGSHDPGTLQSFAPGTTNTKIKYQSDGSFVTF